MDDGLPAHLPFPTPAIITCCTVPRLLATACTTAIVDREKTGCHHYLLTFRWWDRSTTRLAFGRLAPLWSAPRYLFSLTYHFSSHTCCYSPPARFTAYAHAARALSSPPVPCLPGYTCLCHAAAHHCPSLFTLPRVPLCTPSCLLCHSTPGVGCTAAWHLGLPDALAHFCCVVALYMPQWLPASTLPPPTALAAFHRPRYALHRAPPAPAVLPPLPHLPCSPTHSS